MILLGLNKAELSAFCVGLGFPAFRGKQIAEWIYDKGVREISEMSNLPAAMREQLAQVAGIGRSEIVRTSGTADGTTKALLKLSDGETIESVLLPYAERTSVCVSSQVGCAAGCAFCATAMCGFVRNLTPGEIVDQVITLQEMGAKRVSHVVFMGMGEPLLNFENVLHAISILNDEVGIGMRRITISTVGITPKITELRDLDLQLTLAISLHAPDDDLRRKIIPLAAKYPLPELLAACRDYADVTKRRVTFEYLLIDEVNSTPLHAQNLAQILSGMLCNVNLIPYNEVPGKDFKRPSRATISAFKAVLEKAGIEATQRMERGHSAAAACGQLRRHNSADQ